MAFRRRRRRQQQSMLVSSELSDKPAPNHMEQLAFKYMEMCKVESSTDSDSEISPRWSDTSTMECASSAPESGSSGRTLPLVDEYVGRNGCYSLFLDPYDGSSEDSDQFTTDVSGRRTRPQGRVGGGGSRFLRRSRRLILHHSPSLAQKEGVKNGVRDLTTEQQHHVDVQMKCGSEAELWVCDLVSPPSHTDNMAQDSTMHSRPLLVDESGSSTRQLHSAPGDQSSFQIFDSSTERSPSPCHLTFLYKRKLGVPGADVVEMGQRKRQCVVNMEDEPEGRGSISDGS